MLTDCVNTLKADLSLRAACELVGLSRATKHRQDRPVHGPRRKPGPVTSPNALNHDERAEILTVLNDPEFVDKAPTQVFYTLLERGCYLGSPRTMYRVLAAEGLVRERRPHATHPPRVVPHLHADGPCQVASWDITALPSVVKRIYFYAFVMIDIYSRFMPAALAYPGPREEYTQSFIEACIAGFDGVIPTVIHSDNGSAMIATSVAQLYERLHITRSLSRPRVSNDNPFSEAVFKTTKYCPAYPGRFEDITESQVFLDDFRHYYNNHHYHSGLRFYTPASVHNGTWRDIQGLRQHTLDAAYAANPRRFTRPPLAASPPTSAWINQPRATITTTDPRPAHTKKN